MAEEDAGSEDKTEEATQERRDEFREQGQVAYSREITSVLVLCACIYYLSAWSPKTLAQLERTFITSFESISTKRIDSDNILGLAVETWKDLLTLIVPLFAIVFVVATAVTLGQTRLNWSWDRIKPDWSRLNPISGIARMFEMQTFVELLKSIAKLIAVSTVAYLILRSEWAKVPALMNWPMASAWAYWGKITKDLFWAVAGFLLVLSSADYLYQFISYERRIKMTKQEVKEDYKRREVDPNVKGRMRRMQREAVTRNTIAKTKKATVLVTNPTHFSIALKYDPGDGAPMVIAKGEDDLALRMRVVARDEKIPIIENRPLARALYAQVEEGEEIPSKFYAAVAEIIKYVYRLKGKRLPDRRSSRSRPPQTNPSPASDQSKPVS
jgi:flagellar biosynthetic protein FlhB